jgi:hypothetical protein
LQTKNLRSAGNAVYCPPRLGESLKVESMLALLQDLAGPEFTSAALWTLLALVLLVIILVIIRMVRSLTFGTYVVGGKNRKTRLAVMDATAVDSHRRLVLVRRDDIEHLILIGGPTDVVVEQNIRAGVAQQAARRPGPPEDAPEPAPRPRPPVANVPAQPQSQPRPAEQQAPRRAQAPLPAPARAAPPAPAQARSNPPPPARAPLPEPRPRMPVASLTPPPPAARKAASTDVDDLDRALMNELEVSLDTSTPAPPRKKKPEMSLEDEMNKLLGELTNKKK